MASEPEQPNRRQFTRIQFHRPAILTIADASLSCRVLDVSLKGALLLAPTTSRPQSGQECSLEIQLDPHEAVIRMEGVVAHVEGPAVGVRCTGIDLDSIAHLRRLVELNLGDEDLLHRELAALISQPR
ncbi:MAG TPA: PilZ domain-containing protein [Anaeromyxobacter sp.]|nr:PilZ domain-containing protein [Anaeromyxobacter sp.]